VRVSIDGYVYLIQSGIVYVRKKVDVWEEHIVDGVQIVDVVPTVGIHLFTFLNLF
jgi:hypothetical protein